jgi:hypothetical protein
MELRQEAKGLDANWSTDADSHSDWDWRYVFRNRDCSPALGRWASREIRYLMNYDNKTELMISSKKK